MLVKLGTLTYHTEIDDEEHIQLARKQSLPDVEELPAETDEIYQTTQSLYFDSDTREFFRGYDVSLQLHYAGHRYFLKRLDLSKADFEAMNWNGFTMNINGGLFNLYRCGNSLK